MSARLDNLQAQNPDILHQLQDWQVLRQQVNQDPRDWGAFRVHQQAAGAPDPGPEMPEEFLRNDWNHWEGVAPI